jgi:hypothetical protein
VKREERSEEEYTVRRDDGSEEEYESEKGRWE